MLLKRFSSFSSFLSFVPRFHSLFSPFPSLPKTASSLVSRFEASMNLSTQSVVPFQFKPADRVSTFGPTVWHEFSPLAQKYGACNLGQGFPNFEPPDFVLKAIEEVFKDPSRHMLNQYTRSGGHGRLVNVLAKIYSPLLGRQIDPMTEIVTSVGASEGICAAILALVNPGDEVLMIEPFFDIYEGAVVMAGGVIKSVPLRPPKKESGELFASDWTLDEAEMKRQINSKTRLLIINSPHNPTGKVFTRKELEMIANIVRQHPNLTVISDEVYEWMVYGVPFERFATLPGMYERTLSVGSAGKTFSITGWKVGWLIGGAPLIAAVMAAHQYIPFSVATPLQEAVAVAFEEAPSHNYFEELGKMYLQKRDKLVQILKDLGLQPVVPQGSYFIIMDSSNILLKENEGTEKSITNMFKDLRGWRLCRFMTTEIGVAAIPLSAFCSPQNRNLFDSYIRLTFCKTEETLDEAARRLLKLKDRIQK